MLMDYNVMRVGQRGIDFKLDFYKLYKMKISKYKYIQLDQGHL